MWVWFLLQATVTPPQAANDSGIGPFSVLINSWWILFALTMLAVSLFFFRHWNRRAKFSAQQSEITPPVAPGTLAGSNPEMTMPRDVPQSGRR